MQFVLYTNKLFDCHTTATHRGNEIRSSYVLYMCYGFQKKTKILLCITIFTYFLNTFNQFYKGTDEGAFRLGIFSSLHVSDRTPP